MPKLADYEILQLAEKLPAISVLAVQLLSLIDNPKTTREQIASLVSQDEVLFAQCFKHANSAMSGLKREINTIKEIVDYMGFIYIKRAALFTAAKTMINDPIIWFDSVFTAVAAEYLAKKAGLNEEEADQVYMAGLFHNYGAYLLKVSYPAIYQRFINMNDFQERARAEREEFGYVFTEISHLVLDHYGVPDSVLKIIATQDQVYSDGASRENAFVEIARVFADYQRRKLNSNLFFENLAIGEIEKLVSASGLNILNMDADSFAKISNTVSEFV